MAQTTRNAAWKRKRFERQRREAIEREQIERCYKQHTPPQIRYCNDLSVLMAAASTKVKS